MTRPRTSAPSTTATAIMIAPSAIAAAASGTLLCRSFDKSTPAAATRMPATAARSASTATKMAGLWLCRMIAKTPPSYFLVRL